MRSEFKILTALTDIRDKSIHITASQDIARRSVEAARLIVCEKENPQHILEYETLTVKRSEITLILKEWPQANSPYVLTIKDITNIVDEPLSHAFVQTLIFKSDIVEQIQFKTPVYLSNVTSPFALEFAAFNPVTNETVTTPFVTDTEKPADDFSLGYMIEIASDPVFNHLLDNFYTTKNKHMLSLDYEGQVFMRVRVQKTDPQSEHMRYGYWTVHTFTHTPASSVQAEEITEEPIYEPNFEIKFTAAPSYNYDVVANPSFTFQLNTPILNQSQNESQQSVALPHYTEERFLTEETQDSFYLKIPCATDANALIIYINGRRLTQNSGYALDDNQHTVRFETPIGPDNIVLCVYKMADAAAGQHLESAYDFANEEIIYEEENVLTQETQSDFYLSKAFQPHRSYVEVYLNGRRLTALSDYALSEDGHTVHFNTPVAPNNVVLFFYQTIQAKTYLLLDNYTVHVFNYEKEIPIQNVLTENNTITLYFAPDILQNNNVYTVTFKNIITQEGNFSLEAFQIFTKADAFYSDILSVQNLLPSDMADAEIFASLVNASKLTDYYAAIKLNSGFKNRLYYQQVPNAEEIEKAELTKYLAAKDCLLKLKARVAGFGGTGMKATLGEITLDLDLSANLIDGLLQDYDDLIKQWKDALQGYKDFIADSATVVKSTWIGVHWRDNSHNPATRSRLNFIHTPPPYHY